MNQTCVILLHMYNATNASKNKQTIEILFYALYVVMTVSHAVPAVLMTQPVINTFLAVHNAARAAVSVGPLRWNNTLSNIAANLSVGTGCKFQHSGGPFGENVFGSSPLSRFNKGLAEAAVKAFVVEKAFVDAKWSCLGRKIKSCGHYTQVVWRSTTSVGCAIFHCPNARYKNLVFCEYFPRGNFLGQKPF
ncbi:hypothetical protein Btru_027833 [Bulinus truncatus]|nr:hypothetical protein Btru_027833 [Bulinus truncatus]